MPASQRILRDGDKRVKLDLIILGIRPDGHTCSLFPGTDALTVHDRWYVANWVPQQGSWRLTATFPLLRAAPSIPRKRILEGGGRRPGPGGSVRGTASGSERLRHER